jgi:hypothetical protein
MSRLSHIVIDVFVLPFLLTSCNRIYDTEISGPHTFKFGEELDSELSVKGISNNWEYEGAGLDPEKTFFLCLQRKSDFSLNGFWSPLDSKECNEKVKEWFETRSCHAYSGTINSSLAFCDGPVQITCDHELFGIRPGENLSAFFTIRWQNRDVHSNVRLSGPELTVTPKPESKEYESADEFFRIGDCIPGAFYIYPAQDIELQGYTIQFSIPVQKLMLLSYVKEQQSGNPDAAIRYEKDTLHAAITF